MRVVDAAAQAAREAFRRDEIAAGFLPPSPPYETWSAQARTDWERTVRAVVDVLAANDCCPLRDRLECEADPDGAA